METDFKDNYVRALRHTRDVLAEAYRQQEERAMRDERDPKESVPVDKDGISLQGQWCPNPDWGREIESELKAKRGPTGKSKHPGFP